MAGEATEQTWKKQVNTTGVLGTFGGFGGEFIGDLITAVVQDL